MKISVIYVFCAKSIWIFLMQLNCHWLTSGPSEVYLFEWNYCEIMNEYFHICHLFVHNLFRFFWRNLTVSVQFEWKPWRYLLLTYFVQNIYRFFWRNITVSVQRPTTALVVHRFFFVWMKYWEIMNGYFHICPLFCAKSI